MHLILFILTLLLCAIGLLLSAISFSGTWLVLLAALITRLSIQTPTTGTLILFTLLCIATELLETFAGYLGVKKRGGSRLGGAAAVVGGLLGAAVGSVMLPIIGTLAGLLLGSFALAYLVEYRASGRTGKAAHIARGAVIARLGILFLKTALTLGMSIWLCFTLIK